MYNEASKKSTLKYKKDKQHPISLSYKKTEFESKIRPAIEKSGLPVATFVKEAIKEKIERDNPSLPHPAVLRPQGGKMQERRRINYPA